MVWSFERGPQQLTCEVRKTLDAYEIATKAADGICSVQYIETAGELLEQIEAIPTALLRAGWQPVARPEYRQAA
jgi:hypothetical protein